MSALRFERNNNLRMWQAYQNWPEMIRRIETAFEILKAPYSRTSVVTERRVTNTALILWQEHHHKAKDALRGTKKERKNFYTQLKIKKGAICSRNILTTLSHSRLILKNTDPGTSVAPLAVGRRNKKHVITWLPGLGYVKLGFSLLMSVSVLESQISQQFIIGFVVDVCLPYLNFSFFSTFVCNRKCRFVFSVCCPLSLSFLSGCFCRYFRFSQLAKLRSVSWIVAVVISMWREQ